MRGTRLGGIAIATVAVLLAGPVTGARATAIAPPDLTATTVVTADGTGYTPVTLTSPMSVPLASATPIVSVSDPANFVELALVMVQQGPPTGPLLQIVSMPAGQSSQYVYGCAGAEPGSGLPFCAIQVLPAGIYRLYVIATGPEQVTLNLPAPQGAQTLAVSTSAVSYSVVSTAPGAAGMLVVPAVSAEGQFDLPNPDGLLIADTWAHGQDVTIGEDGICYYGGSTLGTLTEPAPWLVCPGGFSGQVGQIGYAPSTSPNAGGGDVVALTAGTFGIKAAEILGGLIQDADVRLIWLDWGSQS